MVLYFMLWKISILMFPYYWSRIPVDLFINRRELEYTASTVKIKLRPFLVFLSLLLFFLVFSGIFPMFLFSFFWFLFRSTIRIRRIRRGLRITGAIWVTGWWGRWWFMPFLLFLLSFNKKQKSFVQHLSDKLSKWIFRFSAVLVSPVFDT